MTTNEDEHRAFERLLDAARQDSPPPELGERVLDHLAYRKRLERLAVSPPSRRGFRAAAGAFALAAAAAGVLLLLFARKPVPDVSIAAEHERLLESAAASVATPPSSAQPALPAVDPCLSAVQASGNEPLIDDFEDGDDAVRPLEGRTGFWRWPREIDAPGTAPALIPVPRPDATRGNRLAQHVKGGQLLDWGATIEFDFRPTCYDASKYVGVSFQARGPGRIYFAARERSVIPIAEGGSCQSDCHNPHVAKIELESGFRSYQVRFAELRQRGLGKPPLDTHRLHSLAFLIRPEDTPYDVWLDDVRFLQR